MFVIKTHDGFDTGFLLGGDGNISVQDQVVSGSMRKAVTCGHVKEKYVSLLITSCCLEPHLSFSHHLPNSQATWGESILEVE